jgi:hypothetical protein
MKIVFVIDGPLQGYRQTTKKSILHPKERERSKAYGAWKEKVRILAVAAGLRLSGSSEITQPTRLSVKIFWKTATRIDWKNVYGAIEDALWYAPQGDRYVRPGPDSDVVWGSDREEAIVTVEF